MILLSFDIETTGLDIENDRIIEYGFALYSTTQKKILESAGFLVQSDGVLITPEITEITGITQAASDRFGYSQIEVVECFDDFAQHADAIIGHNINRFDFPFIKRTAERLDYDCLPDKLPIDTMTDIPNVRGEQLITMCAKKGFVNPNQHSAEDDAKSVLKLISYYDMDAIVERAKSPLVVLQSHQSRDNNEMARKLRFRWHPVLRGWFKIVKEMDVQETIAQATFDISRADKDVYPTWD